MCYTSHKQKMGHVNYCSSYIEDCGETPSYIIYFAIWTISLLMKPM